MIADGAGDAATTVQVTPDATPAELAAILAVVARRAEPAPAPPTAASPWHEAARRGVLHRGWPRATLGGWSRAARREMQHAEHG
ncbi:MAG TPA: hypothetical protein VFN57_01275 [Thermomicrobiaceae bacterium]|nr:hypothetical protein [Thermomicrobiaceae bacterium]